MAKLQLKKKRANRFAWTWQLGYENRRVILLNPKKKLNKMGYLRIFQSLVFNPFILPPTSIFRSFFVKKIATQSSIVKYQVQMYEKYFIIKTSQLQISFLIVSFG